VLRELVEEVYSDALLIYESLVRENFPKLLTTLGMAAALPVRLEGVLSTRHDPQGWDGPNLWLTRTLLHEGESSSAAIHLGEGPAPSTFGDPAEWEKVMANVERLRPRSKGWLRLESSLSICDHVFGDTPAIDQAYRWLWGDLKHIGLVKNLQPYKIH
jgi:hypothetical protein